METRHLSRFRLLIALALAGGLVRAVSAEPLTVVADPQHGLGYDQVEARIPWAKAAVAPAALAELTIALHQARRQAEQTLCQGGWTPSGEVLQQVGPTAETGAAGKKVWFYRSLRRAHPLACDGVSRARFFREMSRHLPAWVAVRPAGQLTEYSQGNARPVARVAVR